MRGLLSFYYNNNSFYSWKLIHFFCCWKVFHELCFAMLKQYQVSTWVCAIQLVPERNQHHNERHERFTLQLVRVSHKANVEWRQYRELSGLQESAGTVRATLRWLRPTGRCGVLVLFDQWLARGCESDTEEAFAISVRWEGMGQNDGLGEISRALVHESQDW